MFDLNDKESCSCKKYKSLTKKCKLSIKKCKSSTRKLQIIDKKQASHWHKNASHRPKQCNPTIWPLYIGNFLYFFAKNHTRSYLPKNASHRTENCKSSPKKKDTSHWHKNASHWPALYRKLLVLLCKKPLVRSLYFRSQVTPDHKNTCFGILRL